MTLLELLDLMKKRIKLVIGLPIVCALLIGAYSFMFMPDTYTATTSMYVLTNQEQSAGNLSTDLSASQMVANDVTTLLNSKRSTSLTQPLLPLRRAVLRARCTLLLRLWVVCSWRLRSSLSQTC